ncbi:MAG: phosphoribosylaminoimidazolesuccinocarboxamide synthase [Thermoleophilia bacterium]
MTRGEQLYEGKAKIVYATDDPDVYIQDFKDSATAFDGKKKGTIGDKGRMNNAISSQLFGLLEEAGVPTHFLGLEGATGMRIHRLDMFMVEFVVRNVAAGSLSKRIGYPEGTALKNPPIVEYYHKDDELGDPLLCMAHLDELEVISPADLAEATSLSKQVNQVLTGFFSHRRLTLVDFKLEFGKDSTGKIRLGDEISPDTCRLWDADTNEKLDKDRFRRDLGGVEDAYAEVLRRITGPAQA